MNKKTTRFLSFLLAACLLFALTPMGNLRAEADAKTYKTGDIITFGGYPQTKVTDSKMISALNKLPKKWVSCQYSSGNGTTMQEMSDFTYVKKGDFMRYADVVYQGAVYRAVIFDVYRPYGVMLPTGSTGGYSSQDDNGYACKTVYYFRYEPLKWRVLDPAAGLVLCESIVDAQPFQNLFYKGKGTYGNNLYQDAALTRIADDYRTCSLRIWLQKDFFNTAFSAAEQAKIDISALNYNLDYGENTTIYSQIFLLANEDVYRTSYGFSGKNVYSAADRQAAGSDYAKCQGLDVDRYNKTSASYGKSGWLLRSRHSFHDWSTCVDSSGGVSHSQNCSIGGVRPAFCFSAGISEDNNPRGGFVQPGDVDGDGKVAAADARLALRAAVGLEKYAKDAAQFLAADVNKDGAITAEDARLILRAAVGLETLS